MIMEGVVAVGTAGNIVTPIAFRNEDAMVIED